MPWIMGAHKGSLSVYLSVRGEVRGEEGTDSLKLQTDIHTEPQTKRVVDELSLLKILFVVKIMSTQRYREGKHVLLIQAFVYAEDENNYF